MTRAVALAAVALLVGCGGESGISRAEAEQRAEDAVAAAQSDGTLAGATAAADESMNRDEGTPLGAGVESAVRLGAPSLEERDDGWVAAYAVIGGDAFVCAYVEDETRVEVRERC